MYVTVGAFSWLMQQCHKYPPTPLSGLKVRYSADGPFFARLRYYLLSRTYLVYQYLFSAHESLAILQTIAKETKSEFLNSSGSIFWSSHAPGHSTWCSCVWWSGSLLENFNMTVVLCLVSSKPKCSNKPQCWDQSSGINTSIPWYSSEGHNL